MSTLESNATGAMAKEIALRLLDKLRIFQRVEGREQMSTVHPDALPFGL